MHEHYGEVSISSLKNGTKAVYSFKNTVDKNKETISTVKIDVKDKQGVIVSWGKNNDYPQKIMEAVRLNGTSSSALRFQRKAHYGNGIVFYKEEADANGKKAPKLVPITELPEVHAFFKKSFFERFSKETIADLEYFSIAFPEYVLSDNFQTVNRVKRQKTAWCRFEVMNEQNGLVEHVYISEKFGKGSFDVNENPFVEKVALIDPYLTPDEVRAYCQQNKIHKFIRPIFYPFIDEAYYPKAEWHAVIESGWMEVANSVPALKKAIFENQMTIKFKIDVDPRYFEQVYAEKWGKMSVEERMKIREQLIDKINESLVGNDKAGKAIQSLKIVDRDGKVSSAIEITAIDDKLKDGSYLPEAEAANSEIAVAIGVDASLIGGAGIPGGKIGAGSGSDKRVAFDVLNSLKKSDRETTLEVYDFIAQYNGWDLTIRASFENTRIETLDKNPTGTTNITA
ncbi:hypothetical protein V3Q77_08295 [Flavobacterium davisii]|uniref:Phage portal protein n=1 Tax=Flavobacterium davisii TaxID=2906077 RepID=A0ABW8PPQ0_9FLAO